MKQITLTQGKFALIDDEDFKRLNKFNWSFDGNYARRNIIENNSIKKIYLHRIILNVPNGMEIDHKDLNKLNCQKQNLRICTSSQNRMNRKIQSNNTSGFKGVIFNGKYIRTSIKKDRTTIYLGNHFDLISAAKAYDAKAIELFGEFARLNFPRE